MLGPNAAKNLLLGAEQVWMWVATEYQCEYRVLSAPNLDKLIVYASGWPR